MTWPSYVRPIYESVNEMQRLAEKLDAAARDAPKDQRSDVETWAKQCRQLKGAMRFWIEGQY